MRPSWSQTNEASVTAHAVEVGPEAQQQKIAPVWRKLKISWRDTDHLPVVAFGPDDLADDVRVRATVNASQALATG